MTPPPREGVLPVDKPVGPTSHDIVDTARRALGIRRIGHTGTLDPLASGLLLLCLGPTTRIAEYLTGLDKEYDAEVRLGFATETGDAQGAPLGEADPARLAALEPDAVEAALDGLRGEIRQVPPQFSSKKVRGTPMHRRARRGETVALEAGEVTVHELVATELKLPVLSLRVRCSSGTYIRAIARDLGAALGVGGHLTGLRRTRIGSASVAGALTPDELADPEAVARACVDPLRALVHMPEVAVSEKEARRLGQGQPLAGEWGPERTVAVSCAGTLLAVAEAREGLLRPRKVFPRG